MSATLTSRAHLPAMAAARELSRGTVCSNHNRHGPDPIWLTQVMYCGMVKSAQKELLAISVCKKYIPQLRTLAHSR